MDYTSEDIKEIVIDYAKDFWKDCPADFCIQYDDFPEVMIFGSVNRVIWRLESGFTVDKSYCTKAFLRDNEGRV